MLEGLMRKIGIVSEYFYPHLGGITEHVYYFSKEMLKRGYEVVLLTGDSGEASDVKLPRGLRIIRFGKSIPIYSNHSFAKLTLGWGLGNKIKKVLAEEKFDLLHIHSPVMPILPMLFQKHSNTVTVGTFHTYFDAADSHFFYKTFQKLVQSFLDDLDGKIAVGPSCIEAMNEYFDAEYTIIPNGVDVDWFAKPTGTIAEHHGHDANILFLGRLDPRNGLDDLLQAFPDVVKEIPQARLIVAGDGPLRPFYEDKAGSLLKDKIFFAGQVNGNRPDYFASSQVFCYPANKASFGITLLEAMASGKPIVAADNPGFRGVLENGLNGLLYPPENPKALAQSLTKILGDPAFAKGLIEQGKKSVEQYSWSRVTDRVLEFYDEVYMKKKGERFTA